MKPHIRFLAGSASVAALFLSASLTSAQEDNSRPRPAAREYSPLIEGLGGQDSNDERGSTTNLNPDTRPLTGVQNPTLGTRGIRHSYWLPGFQYADTVRSSALNQATSSGWNTTSFVAGNLSVLEAWSRAQLAVNYSGGASLSSDSAQGNSHFHQLGLVQTFDWGRWQLQFLDQFFKDTLRHLEIGELRRNFQTEIAHGAFASLPLATGKPSVVICDTVRGKGLPSIEKRADRWFVNFSRDEVAMLLKELHGVAGAKLTSETLMVR